MPSPVEVGIGKIVEEPDKLEAVSDAGTVGSAGLTDVRT